MTPIEEAHLCAHETLVMTECGVCTKEDILAALRCISRLLAMEMSPGRVLENETKVSLLNANYYGKN